MSRRATEVVHVAGWYAPYRVGGTEVYVEGLVAELGRLGIGCAVLVPRPAEAPEQYRHANVSVETYPVNDEPVPREFTHDDPHQGFEVFCDRLRHHRGGIYHQHSWTRGCGLHHLLAARELGMRTVVTVHVPGNFCLRGTMLRFGSEVCDGEVAASKCGACWAEGRGLAKPIARALSHLPLGAAKLARRSGLRAGTALAGRALAAAKSAQLRCMVEAADRIVAVCGWVQRALIANGVPPQKLSLSRQGVSRELGEAIERARDTERDDTRKLKLLYLGGLSPVKGIDCAIGAVRALPDRVRVSLTIHAAPARGSEQVAYEARLRHLAADDPRINFAGPVQREALADTLHRHDALVVPSVCLETGPLVVLEAQAAGLFVIGSRIGGIAELVEENGDGLLIEAGSTRAWAEAIERLASENARGKRNSRQRRRVRTMEAAAAEMADLYRSL